MCGKKTRVSTNELASRKCEEFASRVGTLDPHGGGLQAPHDPSKYIKIQTFLISRFDEVENDEVRRLGNYLQFTSSYPAWRCSISPIVIELRSKEEA